MTVYIDKKFINMASIHLDKFKWKSDTLANCRCPICGDSQKNKTKPVDFFTKKVVIIFISVIIAVLVILCIDS